jgi:hypothetical protein
MTPKSIPGVAPRRLRLIGIIAAIAAIGLGVYGIADRAKSKQEVQISPIVPILHIAADPPVYAAGINSAHVARKDELSIARPLLRLHQSDGGNGLLIRPRPREKGSGAGGRRCSRSRSAACPGPRGSRKSAGG